ncbi:MAG TPA: serine/threonine-protein kinase, partial [Ktedonobacteraceae bacterium]|nr:serine/threonine-protein kinase [Ktedonobacteraceae bacterium]
MMPDEMLGRLLGHYQLLRSLGYGGSATVFLARDIHLQREVAIKVFMPGDGSTQDFLRRFELEARVLAQLDHPHILPVYEYGKQDGNAYLVMPHMVGGSLRDWLRGRGAVSPAEVVRLMSQMLSALQYAHERNLIHRDIKPGNMLFKADGTLMLADFGLVKLLAGEDGKTRFLNEPTSM